MNDLYDNGQAVFGLLFEYARLILRNRRLGLLL